MSYVCQLVLQCCNSNVEVVNKILRYKEERVLFISEIHCLFQKLIIYSIIIRITLPALSQDIMGTVTFH